MHQEDLKMNPPDVRNAVLPRRMRREVREKCSQLFVLIAARNARCPSSLLKAKRFTAASASQLKELTRSNSFGLMPRMRLSIETNQEKSRSTSGIFPFFKNNYIQIKKTMI